MDLPDSKRVKAGVVETGAHPGVIQVSPVSHLWVSRLVLIDASWNPKSWSERLFEQELHNPAARIRGVFVDDTLVGYLIAHVVLDESHIVSLGIDPAFRGRGLGRRLLEDLLRIARLERIAVVTLQVRCSNQVAQRLYSSVGFQVVGVRKRYYSDNGEDAITMRCEIGRRI